jgi:hypothetical protein
MRGLGGRVLTAALGAVNRELLPGGEQQQAKQSQRDENVARTKVGRACLAANLLWTSHGSS